MNANFTSIVSGLIFLLGSVGSAEPANLAGLKSVSGAGDGSRPQEPCKTAYRAIRLIEDPSTHLLWMLLKDLRHPSAPALLAPVLGGSRPSHRDGEDCLAVDSTSFRPYAVPIIRVGEELIVEEHSYSADARLEGTALEPAAVGEALRVRLKKSGKILSVIADAPGRATIVAERIAVRW